MPIMPLPLQLVDHLRALRAVCAVDSCGSSVAAAQALHLSQSSVVRAVQALEATLGGALFERSGRGMVATEMGRSVALRTRRALSHLASVDPRGRRAAGSDALAWTASRLAAGVGVRHLAVLPALAQEGSEAAGGTRLGISQSAVHQTLVQLEHMAGAALFVRGRRGLRATEAGEAVLRAFKLAYAELDQAGDELAARRGVVQGRLVIGTLPFSTGRLLSEAVDRVLRAHPGLGITIIDGTYKALLHQLRHADIDLLVGALRPTLPGPDLQQETLFLDQLAVVARARHPLAQRPHLAWQDLRDQAWIMPMPNTPAQTAFEAGLAGRRHSPAGRRAAGQQRLDDAGPAGAERSPGADVGTPSAARDRCRTAGGAGGAGAPCAAQHRPGSPLGLPSDARGAVPAGRIAQRRTRYCRRACAKHLK